MAKNYYTQDDAELLADWFNFSNQANTTAGISDEVRKLFFKADNIRIKLHRKIVKNSNWRFYRVKSNKVKVKEDRNGS
jgi:hypothetical protein